MIVVTTPTGQIGNRLVRELLARNRKVESSPGTPAAWTTTSASGSTS